MKERTRYLYIVGRGYSGSTILSILVGQSATVASEGEIIHGFSEDYTEKRCVDGLTFKESPFWQAVIEQFGNRESVSFDIAVRLLKRRAHFSFLGRNLFMRRKDSDAVLMRRIITALYDSIAAASGRSVVFDSSKELATAVLLLRGVEGLRVIHLVRSPLGVVDSYVKRIKKEGRFDLFRRRFQVRRFHLVPVALAAVVWAAENIFCEVLRILHPTKIVRVHYEDLCATPLMILEHLENFTGLSLVEAKEAVTNKHHLKQSHAFCGNRLLWKQQMIFAPERGRANDLTAVQKAVVVGLTFPLLLTYGYLNTRRRSGSG